MMYKNKCGKRRALYRTAVYALLCLTVFVPLFSSCTAGAPDESEIRSVMCDLIPKAAEINEAVWGKGLELSQDAVLKEDSVVHNYYPVSPDCPYQTKAEFSAAVSEVFSAAYTDVIMDVAFGSEEEGYPRYGESEGVLTRDISNKGFELSTELFPEKSYLIRSAFGMIEIGVPCTFRGKPDEDYKIVLVDENGKWKIDSPTY